MSALALQPHAKATPVVSNRETLGLPDPRLTSDGTGARLDRESSPAENAQRALLNTLEDFSAERSGLESAQRALFNILEDFEGERVHLNTAQRAVLNILEDSAAERVHLAEAERALLNILEEFVEEKVRLEKIHRAMLNILDDLDSEKLKLERVNQQLQQEIEDRKQAEKRIHALLETAPNPMVLIDDAGTIVLINAQTETSFGYPMDELLGQPVTILVPERFRELHREYLGNFFAHPIPQQIGMSRDLYGRRKEGSEFPIEIGLYPFQTETGMWVRYAISDITERKRAEEALARKMEELARSNADLEQFAYVASHDLKEPLRAVSGGVQLLQRRYEGQLDERAGEFIALAIDGTSRMERMIEGLLAFSRVGTRGGKFEPVDGAKVLTAALQNLQAAIQESGAVVTQDPLPTVNADAVQLLSLFQNLIGNALKFRRTEPPRIHVGAQWSDGNWRFSVRDNGIGIESQYFERVFGVFQRLHTRREYPGTGIGLAICKKIVERHGGRIWVESMPGEGSTFYFTLADAQAVHRQPEREAHA